MTQPTRRDTLRILSSSTLSLFIPTYALQACVSPPETSRRTTQPSPKSASCSPTQSDIKGPFFRPNSPTRIKLAPADEPGQPIRIVGRVFGPDCTTPIPNAYIEVWHADKEGRYDDDSTDFRLRGNLSTDKEGRYGFESIRPGRYPLGGSLRPAHLHFTISAPNYRTVTTQVYFKGDPYLASNDPCTVCKSDDEGRIIPLRSMNDNRIQHGVFDITLNAV